MPYIGSSASPLPVNFAAVQAQSFSGTGSQTAFTLNRTIPGVTAIEVLVNNVQQSPYDGSYSVTGTTLTFSEAPSAGTNNVYVVYRDQPVGSLVDESAYRKAEADALFLTSASDIATAQLPAGSVLQVVSTTKLDAFTTTSTTPVDVTGLSVSITPTSATSKILVVATFYCSSATGSGVYLNLVRNSTALSVPTTGSSVNSTSGQFAANNNLFTTIPAAFLDSPNTTSATVYKAQMFGSGGLLVALNRRELDTAVGGSSSITVMEIAA